MNILYLTMLTLVIIAALLILSLYAAIAKTVSKELIKPEPQPKPKKKSVNDLWFEKPFGEDEIISVMKDVVAEHTAKGCDIYLKYKSPLCHCQIRFERPNRDTIYLEYAKQRYSLDMIRTDMIKVLQSL